MSGEASGSRRQARTAALSILYFWEVGQAEPRQAIAAYFREHAPGASSEVIAFATAVVIGTVHEIDDLDRLIEQHARHWRLERLAVVDRLILRMAAWELRHREQTPAAVILDEAIELAREFSTEESARFVNGVLDAIFRTLEAGTAAPPHRQ